MDAIDIMTHPVITATPDTPVLKIAQLMSEHRISGIPLVDGQKGLVGLVTEGDLLRRTELRTEPLRTSCPQMSSRSPPIRPFVK